MTTPCEKLLAEIEARLAEATPGPWKQEDGGTGIRCAWRDWIATAALLPIVGQGESNADLIAHSRTDLEKLAAMVKCARAALTCHESSCFPNDKCRECIARAELDKIAGEDK